ncbi:MAG: hypothetical protein U0232_17915 [Thermomicrobiales bacterium]
MTILRRVGVLACAAIIGLLAIGTLFPGTASAHERRDIVGGKYQAVVGFLTEPAYDNQVNGLDLTVTSKTEKLADGTTAKPIEGLEKTIKAQVIKDGKTLDLTVQSRFNLPGKYAAYFPADRRLPVRLPRLRHDQWRAVRRALRVRPRPLQRHPVPRPAPVPGGAGPGPRRPPGPARFRQLGRQHRPHRRHRRHRRRPPRPRRRRDRPAASPRHPPPPASPPNPAKATH